MTAHPYERGAQEFLPELYRRLFDSGSVAEAVRARRQAMLQQPGRVCARGRFPLADRLVPVLYQLEDADLTFARGGGRRRARAGKGARGARAAAPRSDEAQTAAPARTAAPAPPESESAPAAPQAELGGDPGPHGFVGRDSAARSFVEWMPDTERLGRAYLWFDFQEIRSAGYVLNRIGERLFE